MNLIDRARRIARSFGEEGFSVRHLSRTMNVDMGTAREYVRGMLIRGEIFGIKYGPNACKDCSRLLQKNGMVYVYGKEGWHYKKHFG